mmetsp:Transcript_24272/g.61861  ORF Transcript_24272/g.61861 Transcript_24272/m.61861 type:complete len:221 (-) Transcript_24272:1155-1817(-)
MDLLLRQAALAALQQPALVHLQAEADPKVQHGLQHIPEQRGVQAPQVHIVQPEGRSEGRTTAPRNFLPVDDGAPDHFVEDLAALQRLHKADFEDLLVLQLLGRTRLPQEVEHPEALSPKLVPDDLRGRRVRQQLLHSPPVNAPLQHHHRRLVAAMPRAPGHHRHRRRGPHRASPALARPGGGGSGGDVGVEVGNGGGGEGHGRRAGHGAPLEQAVLVRGK